MSFLTSLVLVLGGSLPAQVKVGADLLLSRDFYLIEGKRIGLVTNHSALLSDGRHLADALSQNSRTRLVVLFGPEHGIRGDAPDGHIVQHGRDSSTGLPVYSLYGKINKPTDEMLKDVDILIFDIQDVGARFYTFESTMMLAMEAAAEHKIPYLVLDRPNPIRGVQAEGPIRADSLKSFVGWVPIPITHGMTIGELATMVNGEGWLAGGVKADLHVVRMQGWNRTMWYDETGLRWIKPSPNMATLRTATVYPGTCLLEGTNVAEGRGTERPFEWIGAPFIDGVRWAESLNRMNLPGVRFEPVSFTPHEIPNVAFNPKYKERPCGGVFVNVTERNRFEPVRTGIAILSTMKLLYPDSVKWRQASIDRLAGTPVIRQAVDRRTNPDSLRASWENNLRAFLSVRAKYLLY